MKPSPHRRVAALAFAVIPLAGACSTAKDWKEVRSAPMPYADVYDGVEAVANGGGLSADRGVCDRGLGIWQSRWRQRTLAMHGRPGRFRLRAEVDVEDGSESAGWLVRYFIEQEKVDDLRRTKDPREEDWSYGGQDTEAEFLFGERLSRRLRSHEAVDPDAPPQEPKKEP